MFAPETNIALTERRANLRFPLNLDVRYFVAQRRWAAEIQSGVIQDISSAGLRFTSLQPVEVGRKIELAINWPVLLDDRVPLQVIATGTVVWNRGNETAVRVHRHEFRTRGVEPNAEELCFAGFKNVYNGDASRRTQ